MTGQDRSSALRYGAPAAVVDPLLSFLFDLRRMEDTILSALEHMGVDRHFLPPPFGTGPDNHRDHRYPTEAKAYDTDDAKAIGGQKIATDVSSSEAEETRAVPSASFISAFDAYVRQHGTHNTVPTPVESVHAVQQVFSWLDDQTSSSSSSASPSASLPSALVSETVDDADADAARALVVAFVAAGEGHDAFLTHAETETEVHVRRRRTERDARMQTCTEDRDAQQERQPCHIVSLSASGVRAAADTCRRFGKLLQSSTRELTSTLRSVTTSELAASYSCHAKWVEVAPEDAKVKCALPTSKTLKRNYEQLICLNDAFATCQAAVHRAYVSLEEAVDVFLEEAEVVDKEERAFQHCVVQAQVECAALNDLRKRLKRTREALHQVLPADT